MLPHLRTKIVRVFECDPKLSLSAVAWVCLLVFFFIFGAHGFTAVECLSLILWGTGSFLLAQRVGYPSWVGWPVALAGFLVVQYLNVTSPWVRQHDVEGHREYVDYLISTRMLPDLQQGWETWQPPLYYGLAAIWRSLFSGFSYEDPFRPVQFLATALFLATLVLALCSFRRLQLNDIEAFGGLAMLALFPAHLFFAGRINNDVVLPLLGTGIMLVVIEFTRTGERRWLWWLAGLLLASLMVKGSSVAIVGGALLIVFFTELRRSDWRQAMKVTYLTGLPSYIWTCFWWIRNYEQTGNPLYVNSRLPEYFRILTPSWQRLLSFKLGAFLRGGYYYDDPIRQSYPSALVTSVLYGEYDMESCHFHWPILLRLGCLGLLLVLIVGAVAYPRREMRSLWITCLTLIIFQTAFMVIFVLQYPYSCNQNSRYFAQAFAPIACLWGLGINNFWRNWGLVGKCALFFVGGAFLLGMIDFYVCLLF
jgi:hypothetical protein